MCQTLINKHEILSISFITMHFAIFIYLLDLILYTYTLYTKFLETFLKRWIVDSYIL